MNDAFPQWVADLPAIRVLGNGRYTVMLHANGGGFSRFKGLALNDWNADRLQESGGLIIYVRNLDDDCVVAFGANSILNREQFLDDDGNSANLVFKSGELELTMKVHVSASHDCEIRQLSICHHSGQPKRLEVSAYLPIALNDPSAHGAHPAFSKLFVQTEFLAEPQALLARRRPRGAGDAAPCMVARLLGPGELRWETDRAKFLGRGWGLHCPQGIMHGLSQHQSNVLDPAFVLQRTLTIGPGASERLTLIMGGADTRDEALSLAAVPLSQLAPASHLADLNLQSLVGAMFYGLPAIGATPTVRKQAVGHPGIVWGYGMPTDRPFFLLMTSQQVALDWVVNAQQYWQSLGLNIPVLALLDGCLNAPAGSAGIVTRTISDVPAQELLVLRAVAAGVWGDLAAESRTPTYYPSSQTASSLPKTERVAAITQETLQFENGYGGFSADGREYVIRLISDGQRLTLPPVPWINVLANPSFGCLITETGAGCTWSVNSRERRLTPWANDPVLDPPGEALYVRDDATGQCWSPLPGPALSGQDYETRHTFGSSRFVHASHELQQQTTIFVHRTLPVKIIRLEITNTASRVRHLSISAYQQLVLGFLPAQTRPFIDTLIHRDQRCLRAKNNLAGEFANQIAFASCVCDGEHQWKASTDRLFFLGREGDLACPAGLSGEGGNPDPLDSGDPCFLQQIQIEIPASGCRVVSFLLGDAASEAEVQAILNAISTEQQINNALVDVHEFWRETLSAVKVETPSAATNIMMNGWLMYQTLACRIWGRTAYYQSSGAFGFRDQLQDSAALIYSRPDLTRQQILLHASRQFMEGDVQHWWHEPPVDRGLRTRFSDDLNWLPFLTAFYVNGTGDQSLLHEVVPYLTARTLQPGEDEAYLQAQLSDETGDIYEHCCRALDISLTKGRHGLPLMGTGDWNDGMNRVGREGKGESIWMGFFLHYVLNEFLPFCEARQDVQRINRYTEYINHLKIALNADGWDGQWYRRAYYDNGEPLGSALSDECKIDALAQAWAIISKAAPAGRAIQALNAMDDQLIDKQGKLIRLLTPSFVNTPNDPGYIKGYVAGVRENGGQYTHAATWVVRAMAEMGKNERALDLLEMLFPISHTSTRADVDRYKTEPYAAVADVYGESPHIGRGGWTWYTGTSGWLYRVGLESVLGFTLHQGNAIRLKPCIPASWPGFTLRYRMPQGGCISVEIDNSAGGSHVVYAELDRQAHNVDSEGLVITIAFPEKDHHVYVRLGK